MVTEMPIRPVSRRPVSVPSGPRGNEPTNPQGDGVVAERVGLDVRDGNDQVGEVGRRPHEPHHPIRPDLAQLALLLLAAAALPEQLPLLPDPPPDHDEVHGDEEHVADGLAERRHEAHAAREPGLQHAHAREPREVVEEEVDHLAGVGEHGERPELPRGAPQGVEAREGAAGPEHLAAEPGRRLPVLGAPREVRVGRLGGPVRELGHVLVRLDQLVDAVALREEDHQLVQRVAGAHGDRPDAAAAADWAAQRKGACRGDAWSLGV